MRNTIVNVGYTESVVTAQRPMVLDPLFNRADTSVTDLGALTYRALMKLDARALPRPDLAGAVVVSPDGLTYTITLGNAKWSDGSPVAADDVVNTVAVVENPGYADNILSAAWQNTLIRVSGKVITVALRQPRASFETELTQLPILPLGRMSHAQLAGLRARDRVALPSSGPFEVIQSDASDVTLAPNPHAAEQPRVKVITLHLFSSFAQALADYKSGASDAIVASQPQEREALVALHQGNLHRVTTFQFDDLLINEKYAGLGDSDVRTALADAVDRTQIVDTALSGAAVAQSTAIPQGITWAVPANTMPKATNSAAMLQQSGWIPGPDSIRAKEGVRLSLPISVPNVPGLVRTANLIALSLRAAGIDAPVEVVPQASFTSDVINPANFALAVVDWNNGPDPDLSEYWRSNAQPPRGFNVSGGAPDLFLDQELDALATLPATTDRSAAAANVAMDLAADQPAVFLDAPAVTIAERGSFHGMVIPPTGGSAARFYSVAQWSGG